jgi:hypothetical protein
MQQPVTLDVGAGALQAPPDQTFTSTLLSYQPDRISLMVQNSQRGLLTVSEAVFPGWEAYVDGQPTPILRADGLLRAVILPPATAGQPHEVTFVYRPMSVRLGSAISLVALALACGLAGGLIITMKDFSRRDKPSSNPSLGQVTT